MKSLYDDSEICIRMSQGMTDFFNVDSGVRQRNSLSPLLSNSVLGFIMSIDEVAGNSTEWNTGRRLRDLSYAEDICLLAKKAATK